MTSLVMTTFNRPELLRNTLITIRAQRNMDYEIIVIDDGDDAATEDVCRQYLVEKYRKLNRPRSASHRNSALPNNVGIRTAEGDVVIIQNAECAHRSPEVIAALTQAVTPTTVAFARAIALNPDGTEWMEYCGPSNPRPYFFCGAIHRTWLEHLRGFDEDFKGYGYEDDDLADRFTREGLGFTYHPDIIVHHQWHPPAGERDVQDGPALLAYKKTQPTIRNLDRPWGTW